MIISRTPFRVTLGGGGTDLPSFYERHGGFVLTMAIDKYIYVNFKPSVLDTKIRLQYLTPEIVDDCSELKHSRAREALKLHDLHNSIEINSIADLPASSGLGSSGSYLVGLLHAIRYHRKKGCHPAKIAEEACDIEINKLNEPVGKQDQYIAAYGGMQVLDIDKNGKVSVRTPSLCIDTMNELLSNMHIYYTGVLRSASEILKEQNDISVSVEDNLLRIKEMGYKFLEHIEERNLDDFGLLLDEHWQSKKKLSSKVVIPVIDSLYEEVKERFGVLGGKIIGAGGGVFLMLYAPKKHIELKKYMETAGLPRLNYSLDYQGSRIVSDLRSSSSFHTKKTSELSTNLWKHYAQ